MTNLRRIFVRRCESAAVILALSCTGCATNDEMSAPFGRWDMDDCTPPAAPALSAEVTIGNEVPLCRLAIRRTDVVLNTDVVDPKEPIVQLYDGRFVAPTTGGAEFAIWSADGGLAQVVGRRGQGPGELMMPSSIYVQSSRDSIFVSDAPGQLEVYSTDGKWVRGASAPGIMHFESAVLLDSGDFLAASPNNIGASRFAVISGSGDSVLRRFGGAGSVSRPLSTALLGEGDGSSSEERPLAYAGGDTFWAASSLKYELTLWELDGSRRAVIHRDVPWFPDLTNADPTRKEPHIATFALDDKGILWVATIVHVNPGPKPAPGAPSDVDVIKDWDLHVEAFDSRTGRLLVSENLDDPYDFFPAPLLPGGRAMSFRPDDDGVIQANVVEYRLVVR